MLTLLLTVRDLSWSWTRSHHSRRRSDAQKRRLTSSTRAPELECARRRVPWPRSDEVGASRCAPGERGVSSWTAPQSVVARLGGPLRQTIVRAQSPSDDATSKLGFCGSQPGSCVMTLGNGDVQARATRSAARAFSWSLASTALVGPDGPGSSARTSRTGYERGAVGQNSSSGT